MKINKILSQSLSILVIENPMISFKGAVTLVVFF